MQDGTAIGAAYESLTAIARLVAQCYGVAHPLELSRTSVARMFARADIRHGGRRPSGDDVKAANSELIDAGVAYRPRDNAGVILERTWALPMSVEAQENGCLESLRSAFEIEQRQFTHYLSPGRLEMLARYCTVTGRFGELDAHSSLPPSMWRFLAYDLDNRFIDSLPGRYRAAALRICLAEAIANLAPGEHIIAACSREEADAAQYVGDIALIRVFQGRFQDAVGVFEALPTRTREAKQVAVEHASIQALIATLVGDDDQAIGHIDRACALEKSGTRKRKVFPASSAFALAVLCFVRVDTPQAIDRLNQLLQVAERSDAFPWLVDFARRALSVRANVFHGYVLNERFALHVLLLGIEHCWMDEQFLYGPRLREVQGALFSVLQSALANDYVWVAAECAEVISRLAQRNRRSLGQEESIAEVLRATADLAKNLHGELGTASLTDLVQPRSPWEQALKKLEVLAFEIDKKATSKKRVPAHTAKERLAWELNVGGYGGASVRPRLQRATKRGWTKGKVVSLSRLATESTAMDALIEQDRGVLAAVKHDAYRWNGHYLDAAGVYQLAGHPHVVSAAGDPVEVIRRDPELKLTESGDELIARLEPYGKGEESYAVEMSGKIRCEVTRFTASHKRLRGIIPAEGLRLPLAAKVRLIDAVASLASEVLIQSDVAGVSGHHDLVDGDPRPSVRLVPAGTGLAVCVLVEPVLHSGQVFTPGQGGENVYAPTANGQVVQVRRDLGEEITLLGALLESCPILQGAYDLADPLNLSHPADCLALLEQLNVAEVRCQWPNGEPFKIVAHAESSQLRINIKSAVDWFAASAELAIDEERVLDLQRLFELMDASPGMRFLELDAGKFVALTESFRRQLDELRAFSAPSKDGTVRIHPLAAGMLDEVIDAADLDADEAWRQQCDRFRGAQAIEAAVPSTLQADLRPYQIEGFHWLVQLSHWGAGACLADDMGLGKTVQTLALLLHRATGGPAIVVAPTSVVANWVNEARRFAPTLNVISYTGDRTAREDLLENVGPFDLIVTTYGLLQNDTDRLGAVDWHSAVLDEAQAIKNIATKRARATLKLHADYRLVTTGTPIQNNLMDLFALFRFINPGMLGTAAEFQRRYGLPIERDGDATVRARLSRLISPFVLRRLKADVLDDLPPRTEITLEVELSPAESALYETLRRRAVDDLERSEREITGERYIVALAHLTKLRLACCNPRLVQELGAPKSSKLAMFADTLDELLANRHKVLVFSQFVKHLKLVAEHLDASGIAYQYLDGGTPARAREKRIAAFQAGEGDVFLISLKAGGTGLNLTAADYVIHLDPWWNPAVEDQASDRAHRIGQTRPVTIYRLVAKGTVEEQIVELHHRKRDLADQLLEGTDTPGRLDTGALLELLRESHGVG